MMTENDLGWLIIRQPMQEKRLDWSARDSSDVKETTAVHANVTT